MAISRYYSIDGQQKNLNSKIYKAIVGNQIPYETKITVSGDRLDMLSQKYYNDPSYWWVIAAASGVGWWLQIPEGVVLNIPLNINDIEELKV